MSRMPDGYRFKPCVLSFLSALFVDVSADLATLDHHTLSIDELLRRFSTSGTQGLDSVQAKRRLGENGPNKLSPPPRNLLRK